MHYAFFIMHSSLCILHYAFYKNPQKYHPKITQNIELLVVCPKTNFIFA